MDEQRLQAYLQLIQQLLAYPAGEEESVLQAQAELVDTGLVEVMGLVADQMAAEGHNNAGWFRQLSRQVAKLLGSKGSSRSFRKMDQFVVEVIQQILQVQGNQAQVYDFWQRNLEWFDEDFLVNFPVVFQQLISQNSPLLIAVASSQLGSLIFRFPLGVRWLNLEIAIAAHTQALEILTHNLFPQDWAAIQNNLANTYCQRIRGKKADNLETAIDTYKKALEVRTRDLFPQDWAMTQNNLGNAYIDRIRGEKTDNLEMAIDAYKKALEVRTQDLFPRDWAMTKNNLGNAYLHRIQGKRIENLEQAISVYKQALQVRTRELFPQDWAETQNNLAIAYRNRILGNRVDNLEKAISSGHQALEIRTQSTFPEQWAATQNNLGIAYSDRIRGDRADNLEQAISAYKQALQVRTRDAFPEEWAETKNNLGIAYNDRIRGDRADNLEQAIFAYKESLEVRIYEDFPVNWADTQSNLAIAYSDRILGDRADNLEQAISAYKQSLKVRTRETFPEQWAETQNNLANTYRVRIRGDRSDNLEQAISAYKQVLEIYTHEAFPKDWAMTQHNLANAYRDRIRGTQADNFERAITAYAMALGVRTREGFPSECRQTARLLGDLQSELQNWDAATQAYGQALAAAEDLYQACTLLDSQAGELKATADLPRRAAYAYAKAGQLAKALETIERGRARGLSERLQRDRADLTQLQQQRPDLFDCYRDITNQLQNLESQQRDQQVRDRQAITPEQHRNEAQRLRQELTEAIAQIRQVPGYETFLQAPSLTEIQQNLSPEAPTVYLIPTPSGIRLAILSACETGLPGLDLADEAISLPVGLLQAGVAGAIASLWAVNDQSTMILLTKFYDLWRNDRLTPPAALRQAQQWLCNATLSEIRQLTGISFRGAEHPFAHPYYWAGFSYTGI